MFLKNKNIIFEIRRSKVTEYAALTAHLNIYLYICQYKPKGVLLGGQFACSRAGANQEIIVSVGEGEAQA